MVALLLFGVRSTRIGMVCFPWHLVKLVCTFGDYFVTFSLFLINFGETCETFSPEFTLCGAQLFVA